MLAREDMGRWGANKLQNKVIDEYNLEDPFQYPLPNQRSMKSPKLSGEEPSPITNTRERSISAPNVNSIINVDRVLPPELSHFRNVKTDIRSKFIFSFFLTASYAQRSQKRLCFLLFSSWHVFKKGTKSVREQKTFARKKSSKWKKNAHKTCAKWNINCCK